MTQLQKILAFLFILVLWGCQDDIIDKYSRPKWLAGKVYTQLKAQPELSTFAKCIELIGYDKILDVSGSYTVFAPSNDAFTLFFQNSSYKKVEDIPLAELAEIVKYHIVQNPWSKIQLRSLDVYGWIDTLDINNNKPRGFKRETLFLGKDLKYGIKPDLKNISIIDTLSTTWKRKAATDSRKYAPIFFKEYLDINDLKSSDFEFYFQRPFENPSDIYFAGAKIIGDEIFAENGFVYVIDKVVTPLKNAQEILKSNSSGQSYTSFLDLIYAFPQFQYNENKTFNQPGASQGFQVDSLFDLSYPELTFNINRENTKAPASASGLPYNVTIRYHHGLMAPTNAAFEEFINQYIAGGKNWGSLKETPRNIKRIIANTYMSTFPVYKTNLEEGFLNGESDLIRLDQSTIVQKQYGSNCTFIGLNKAIIPRAFKSVTGPVYQQRGYSRVMYAIESAGLSSALKRENQNYMLFVESDIKLSQDSSLFYNALTEQFSVFQISGSTYRQIGLTKNDLRNLIMGHIGTTNPKGLAKKEFIKNLGGNYLIINNQTGEIKGTATTMIGYMGAFPATNLKPRQISTNADNGKTFEIDNWFSFSSTDLYSKISASYPKFHNLLVTAGLALVKEYRYSFISESEYYTVFVPNDAAISKINTSAMTKAELQKFLLMHFVQGNIIFTDGNMPSGYYETARVDEKSTQFATVYTQLYIKTEPDKITIKGKSGNDFLVIPESPLVNIITSRTLGTGTETIRNILATAVIHEIDNVLQYDALDTK
jgi:uncharacterized surface protein with fasciclin (FAS1) repeats